jgi:16S rRNA processing protein RimM
LNIDEHIYVGKLGKSVGLKGQMKLFPDTDFPEQFQKGSIFNTNKKLTLKIESIDLGRGVVKFEGIDDIGDAKKLTNQLLYTSLKETREKCGLEKGQYFWFDLIGCTIVEEGKVLGALKDIHRYPITDYFEVETESGLVQEGFAKTFLIPYDENYIKDVDLQKKSITASGAFAILENS